MGADGRKIRLLRTTTNKLIVFKFVLQVSFCCDTSIQEYYYFVIKKQQRNCKMNSLLYLVWCLVSDNGLLLSKEERKPHGASCLPQAASTGGFLMSLLFCYFNLSSPKNLSKIMLYSPPSFRCRYSLL